jgi:hypothetical protein
VTDFVSPTIEAPPGWATVALTAGIGIGLIPALVGAMVAVVGDALGGCGQFGDFGCGAFWALGLFACPGGALGGAVVGGITAVQMTKSKSSFTRRDVWTRSLGLAFLSLFLSGPLSLAILSSL